MGVPDPHVPDPYGQNYYPHDLESIALQATQLELGKLVVFGVRQADAEEDELLVFILFRQSLEGFLLLARQVSHVINEQTGLEVSHVIPVKRIPKTTSGKIQRRLLADAYLQGEYDEQITQLQAMHDQQQQQVDGDLSNMQAELKTLVDLVVSDKNLGIHENFFDAGISSLELAEIHQRIDDKWPGQVAWWTCSTTRPLRMWRCFWKINFRPVGKWRWFCCCMAYIFYLHPQQTHSCRNHFSIVFLVCKYLQVPNKYLLFHA